jgi:hypothetical protein
MVIQLLGENKGFSAPRAFVVEHDCLMNHLVVFAI